MKIRLLHTGSSKEPLCSLLKAQGFRVEYQSLFTIEPIDSSLNFPLNVEDVVIISSQTTVSLLGEALLQWKAQPFYIVGKKTARQLSDLGIQAQIISETGFSGLIEHLQGKVGVFLGAEELAKPAATFLAARNNIVHIPIYRQAEKNVSVCDNIQGIIATSPSRIRMLSSLYEKDIPIFVLGNTSEKQAKEEGFLNIQKTNNPTIEELFDLITQYFGL